MDIAVYTHSDQPGFVRLVYDGGDGGIVEIDPGFMAVEEVDGVDNDWVKLGALPSQERVTAVLARMSDAAAAWNDAIAADGPLVDVGADLVSVLGDANILLGEISRGGE